MIEGDFGLELLPSADLESMLPSLLPDLLRYFIRRLDDREDAADAVAETAIVLWRQERRLPGDEEGLRRYAFGVARRVLATARRGRQRRIALAERLRQSLLDIEVQPVEADGDLHRALAALAARDRELVLLVAWEGFGVAEAGAVLGLQPDAARQRYSRARARLRDNLKE